MGTSRRLLQDGAISLAGAGVGAVAALLLTALVGRALGATGAGLIFQIIGVFAVSTQVLKLGADTGLVRSLTQLQATGRRADLAPTVRLALLPVTICALLVAGVAYVLAPTIAPWLTDLAFAEDVAALLRAVTPFLLPATLLAVLLGGTRGMGGVLPFVGLQNLGVPLLRLALVAAMLSAGAELTSVITAWAAPLALAMGVAGVVLVLQLRRAAVSDGPTVPRRALARSFWAFSSSRAVAASLEMVLEWLDVLILAALRSPAEAGVYAVVTRSMRAGQIAEQAVRVAVSPRIGAALAVADTAGASRLFSGVTRAVIVLAWPFYLLLIVFGDTVLQVFGPEFTVGATALAIVSSAMMLVMAAGMVQTILLMGGRGRWQLTNKLVAVTVSLGLNLALVPRFGILGAALAWSVAVLTDALLATTQVRRMGISSPLPTVLRPMGFAVLVVGGGGLAVRLSIGSSVLGLALALTLCGGLYLVLLWRRRAEIFSDLLDHEDE